MRYRLGLLLALAGMAVLGLGESEAACRVEGEYRVTGPAFGGRATFTETTSDESSSSGSVVLFVSSKQVCPACLVLAHTLAGEYRMMSRSASVSGSLAFGAR